MGKIDTVQLGVAKRGDTNMVKCIATNPLGIPDRPDLVEHFGEVDVFSSLGITAMPADVDEDGAAEGLIVRDCAGTNGIVIGARDERTAGATAQLQPGETCVHSTGPDFDSRMFCKNKSISFIVGNKSAMVLELDSFKVAVGGCTFEMSAENGIVLTDASGNAWITLKDGEAWVAGNSVKLGASIPAPSPTNGCGYGVGTASLASTSVFVAP